MNKFVIGALALTSASSLASAGGSETKDWSQLDRDMQALTSSQGGPATSMFGLSGFVRARGARSNDLDIDPATAGKQKLSGFSLDNARVVLDASQGDFGVHVALEGVGAPVLTAPAGPVNLVETNVGSVELLDAYVTAGFPAAGTGGWKAQMGRFRAPFLWSAMIEENNMILLDRTFNGQVWDERDEGVQISGNFEQVNVWAALQNGRDSIQDDYMWTARLAFTPLGTTGMAEGAYQVAGDTGLTLGAAYSDDGEVHDGAAWCVDGTLTQGSFFLHGELVDYEDDITPESGININSGVLNAIPHGTSVGTPIGFHGSETPWSATAGLMVSPYIGIVARYEDLDDSDDTNAFTVGLNFFSAAGHNAKLTIEGTRTKSDVPDKEIDTFGFGVTVGV